jgi:DNA-binding response OmpR family regulator
VRGEPAVAIVGVAGEATTELAGDLRRLNYTPEVMSWSSSGLAPVARSPIAVIVDLRTLGVDAARACQAVRQDRNLRRAPVLALVHEQEGPRLDFSLGFDDLILAPYRLTELAARLRLLEWRTQAAAGPEVIRVGPLMLNQLTYEVTVEGGQVELTLKEYQLLLFFVRGPGRVFTRAELLDHVWGAEYFGGTRTVDVHVRRLRAKTGAAGEMLETVRGVGYRLVAPVEDAED